MPYPLSRLTLVQEPPIAEAYGWIQGRTFPAELPLIDVSQAVPGYPPPPELTQWLAAQLAEPTTARYTEIAGLPELRRALADNVSQRYGGEVTADDVLITAGCNQAFCLSMLALAEAGDEVLLALPYYFNHRMWCRMQGLRTVHLPFRPDRGGIPDPEDAAARLTARTRAIVLISPNNPTGAVYPPEVIAAFAHLARERGIALVIDETYRDFMDGDAPPHPLFQRPDWRDTLVHLYSFSKVYCLTGYRVGAVVCGRRLGREIAKAMDTVAICAPRIGQLAALQGLRTLAGWQQGNRALMAARLQALQAAMARPDAGYRIVSAGAYFAYLAHPYAGQPSATVARRLADEQNLLCLPGAMFGDGQEGYLRFAFANVAAERMPALAERLARDARS